VIGSFNHVSQEPHHQSAQIGTYQPWQYLYPVLALGIIAAGGTYSGYNPSYTSYEITHHLKTIHAKFVICEPDLLQAVLGAQYSIPKESIFIFNNMGNPIPAGFIGWETLLQHGEVDWYVLRILFWTQRTTSLFPLGAHGYTSLFSQLEHNG
jgi:4-coumarate--CoA ligase